MFADKQIETRPAGKPGLFMERLMEIGRWLTPPPSEPLSEASADWYAGLCVDPHSFSDQLCRLQHALRQTGLPAARPEAVASVVNVSLQPHTR